MQLTRLVTPDDAPALARLLRANREFLAPWEPVRGDGYFTEDGQLAVLEGALAQHGQGTCLPHVVLDPGGDDTGAAGEIVGRITLNGIVRGPFQSCSMGYWIGEAANGRGLATRAVRELTRVAFDELGLHRIQAETLRHNVTSQRVLERNGFVRFGMAPRYLHIAGEWQDHVMFQVLDERPDRPAPV